MHGFNSEFTYSYSAITLLNEFTVMSILSKTIYYFYSKMKFYWLYPISVANLLSKLGVYHANQISMCLDPHLN